MDSLMADMRSRVEAFDVRLMMSDGSFWVASCGARRIRDGGARCAGYWDMCAPREMPNYDAAIFNSPVSMPPEE
jgi:hypothetical protein